MPFASRPSAPVEAPSNGTTSATGRRAQRNSRSGDRRVGDYYHPYGAHRARFAAPHHDRVAHRLCLDGPTSFAATFVLVMKLIRLGSHTGFAPLCGPVLLFAILGAMLGLVTLSPVDARSIRLAFGVCTAYAYIWGMLFFMIGLATAASCETAHELKCANWAFWWFAIAVIDWALASWLIWKRMREPSTGQQRNTRLIGMMWRALRTSACPPARPVSSSASSAMPCMTRTWMGGASEVKRLHPRR